MSTPRQRHREQVLSLYGNICYLASLGGCRGRTTSDHIIRESSLKRWQGQVLRRKIIGEELSEGQRAFISIDIDEIVADPRNGFPVCASHNQPGSKRAQNIAVIDYVPPDFKEFVVEYDLHWLAETELGIADGAYRS